MKYKYVETYIKILIIRLMVQSLNKCKSIKILIISMNYGNYHTNPIFVTHVEYPKVTLNYLW